MYADIILWLHFLFQEVRGVCNIKEVPHREKPLAKPPVTKQAPAIKKISKDLSHSTTNRKQSRHLPSTSKQKTTYSSSYKAPMVQSSSAKTSSSSNPTQKTKTGDPHTASKGHQPSKLSVKGVAEATHDRNRLANGAGDSGDSVGQDTFSLHTHGYVKVMFMLVGVVCPLSHITYGSCALILFKCVNNPTIWSNVVWFSIPPRHTVDRIPF